MSEPSHTSIPNRDSAPSPLESESEETATLSHLPPVHQDAVRRLREKVEQATALLSRLRAENERLRNRVEELEQRPEVSDDKTLLTLDDDPEALRDQVSAFIDTIDTYLEDAPSSAPLEVDESPPAEETPS